MKIATLLSEGLSDIVYHFTSMPNAIKILKTNTFALTSAMAKSSEQEYVKNHYFYLSTTRTKLGQFSYNNREMVCFVLDGVKLRQQYAGESVDYWLQRHNAKDEAEDRLWTSDAYIKNANRFMIRVDAFISEYRMEANNNNGYLRKLVQAADSIDVPVKFYNSSQDFVASKRAIDAETYLQQHATEGPELKPYQSRVNNDILDYIDALKGVNLDRDGMEKFIYNIRYYPRDTLSRLKVIAHNNATTDAMREFTRLALRLKLRNLKQVAEYLNKKYSSH